MSIWRFLSLSNEFRTFEIKFSFKSCHEQIVTQMEHIGLSSSVSAKFRTWTLRPETVERGKILRDSYCPDRCGWSEFNFEGLLRRWWTSTALRDESIDQLAELQNIPYCLTLQEIYVPWNTAELHSGYGCLCVGSFTRVLPSDGRKLRYSGKHRLDNHETKKSIKTATIKYSHSSIRDMIDRIIYVATHPFLHILFRSPGDDRFLFVVLKHNSKI